MSQLPNLFIIGAAKAGTTSLHSMLGTHPEISMSSVKEPQVFATDADPLAGYEGLFAPGVSIRGEASAVYSQFPRWPGVPERIAAAIPKARFVYLVRDPIERALSHYQQHVLHEKEQREPGPALADMADPDSLFVSPSRYATQIQVYLEFFSPDQIRVVDLDHLRADPLSTVREIDRFLDLEPRDHLAGPAVLNSRDDFSVPVGRVSPAWIDQLGRLPVPAGLRSVGRRLLTRPVERVSIDPQLRSRLEAELRGQVEWLREFTGQDFAGWTV